MSDWLDLEDWLDIAKALPQGGRANVPHLCGKGRPLLVCHTDEGYNAWCHRCKAKGYHRREGETFSERLSRLTATKGADLEAAASKSPPMPPVFKVGEWPSFAKVWLYKAGFSKTDIHRHGFYWHEQTQRVVIPIIENGGVSFWQARGFNDKGPKYLAPKGDKPLAVFSADMAGKITLVEDLLSAYRVGAVGHCVCLMGTSLTDKVLSYIIRARCDVNVWLDPDKAGQDATKDITRTLRAVGIDATAIKTELDPKLYSRKEIECLLS